MECDNPKYHSNLIKKNLIKTPEMSHVKSTNWEYVYEPAEDTFLLLDTLEKDLKFINFKKPKIVLEVGSGAGLIITALSQTLKFSYCLAIDINPHACRLTKSTSDYNCTIVDIIQADLITSLKTFSIDMIIFNPPYVVTPSDEVNTEDHLTKSWAGGDKGREVIDKFLNQLVNVMSKKSFGYLLVLKENQPQEVMRNLESKNFVSEIISKRKIRGEELFVIKFVNEN